MTAKCFQSASLIRCEVHVGTK